MSGRVRITLHFTKLRRPRTFEMDSRKLFKRHFVRVLDNMASVTRLCIRVRDMERIGIPQSTAVQKFFPALTDLTIVGADIIRKASRIPMLLWVLDTTRLRSLDLVDWGEYDWWLSDYGAVPTQNLLITVRDS